MLFKKKEVEEEQEVVQEETSNGMPDYNVYIMTKREKLAYTILAMIAVFAIGYIFYHNIILSCILMLLGFKFPEIRTKQIVAKRKNQLTLQFKDMLYSLSSALSVGKSVESGLRDCLKDLEVIYPDPNTDIIVEITYILRGISMNATTESMFQQFADRAHIEDIDNFVDVFVTSKRAGGDIIEVISSTSNTIGEKIEIKQDIATSLSGQKFEFQFLMVMPVAMVLLLSMSAKDYMAPVFEGVTGRVVMTIAIGFFGIAYAVGSKIMDIEV